MRLVEPQTEDLLRLHQTVLEWVAREARPEKILADLCGLVGELIPGGTCIVMSLDPDLGTLAVDVAPGVGAPLIEAFEGIVPGDSSGSCGCAVSTREAIFTEDTRTDPCWRDARELAERFGIRSCWSVPLFSHQGAILGTFSISRGETGGPTEGQQRLARTAGQLAEIVVDRRREREQLHRQERLVDSIVEGSGDVIFAKDLERRYLLANSALGRLVGKPSGALVGTTDRDYFGPQDFQAIDRIDRELLATGEPVQYEFEVEDPAGGDLVFLLSKAPLRTPAGEIRGLLGIGRDVTELRRAQRAVEETQRLKSLGVLTGGIAHDFNNLLTGVLGHAELALSRVPGDPRNEGSLREISKAASRASELIDQMLSYAGQREGQPRPIDLPAFVAETRALLETSVAKNAELSIEAEPDLCAVLADPTQLRQVLMNLLINASEALEGAPGRISVQLREHRAARGGASPDATQEPGPSSRACSRGFVELVVADDGIGMDPATLARIFDPFFTTKFSGRGLGLAATRGIIATHGGWIDVESEPARGSVFRVVLPATEREPVADSPDDSAPAAGRGTILVVDDEEVVRTLAVSVLESAGYDVLVAADGLEALELVGERAGDLALVILDRTMPRLCGREAFLELRALSPDIAFVLSSGYAESVATEEFEAGDLAGYLEKPYRPARLLAAVQAALGQAGKAVERAPE